jgi:hypothetical protein
MAEAHVRVLAGRVAPGLGRQDEGRAVKLLLLALVTALAGMRCRDWGDGPPWDQG